MEDHQIVTIEQLRLVVKDLTKKLEIRSHMLYDIIPHIMESEVTGEDVANFLIHEWVEKYLSHIETFKDEYSKEVKTKMYRDK